MQQDRRRLRSRARRVRCALAVAVASGLALLAEPPTRAEGRRARIDKLAGINQRWEGADCILRIPIQFKKKKPEQGWFESVPYLAGEAGKVEKLVFRLKLRDLRPLAGQMAGQHLVAGTTFRCDGFKFRDEEGYDNAYLALRAQPGDVEGELWLWAGSSHAELKQVESVEQYLRLSLFDVRGRQETLQRVAVPAAGRDAGAGSGWAAPSTKAGAGSASGAAGAITGGAVGRTTESAAGATSGRPVAGAASGSTVYQPRLEILAVAVKPAQIAAGSQVELVVTYIVDGLPPGAAFEVSEMRRLRREQSTLAETTEPMARTNGSYTSTQKAAVPAGVPAGIYLLDVTLRLAGAEASGEALFEVR